MKTIVKLLGIAIFTAAIGFSMTGCMTVAVADPVASPWIQPAPREFYVLGVVEFQQNQRRDITYADVLNHARETFPTANAVLDLRIESVRRTVGPIVRQVFVATGIAIEYVSQPATRQ